MIDVGLTPSRIHAGEITELDISLTNTGSGTCTKVRFAFRLPVGIVRLRGREMIEVSSLPAGQSVTTRLRVRAERVGRYRLISKNKADEEAILWPGEYEPGGEGATGHQRRPDPAVGRLRGPGARPPRDGEGTLTGERGVSTPPRSPNSVPPVTAAPVRVPPPPAAGC